jgi:hypothetical protein
LRRYCHVLTVRIAGEPPAFRGKPRFCKKDTAKRRRDKERLFEMMKFANLRENRDNGKRWDWETDLRLLNVQTHYPPGCNNYNVFVDMSWKDAHIKRTFYDARATYTEPSLPIGTTICDASRAYGNAVHDDVYLSLLIAFPTCHQHHLRVFLPYFWEFLS